MILVTGATGQIGRMVVEHLLDNDVPVRAFVRNEKSFNNIKNSSLELATGTFENKKSIEKAVEGVDRLFLVARDNPDQVAQHQNVIEVAERCGVKHIVKLSAFGASVDSPVALMRWHAETEEQLRSSSMNWTFLRPHLYMHNLLRFGESISISSSFSAPMGFDKFALVDVRDIAEVAAKVLMDEGHAGKIYSLTGPSAISYPEIAERLFKIVNQQISYESVSPEEFYHRLLAAGTPSWRANDLAHIAEAYPGDRKSFINDDIIMLLDRPARSIETFLNDYQVNF